MARKPLYEFGPFRLEPDEHRFFKEGQALGLSPQLFDLLVLLVENAGHLLTKKELRSKLWGEKHLIDPDALKVRIGHLREELGDNQKRPRYIETVWGKGYRFIAPVRQVENEPTGAAAEGESAPPESPPAQAALQVEVPAVPIPQAQRRSLRRVWFMAACVLLLAIISVLAWPFVFSPHPPRITGYHPLTHEGHQIGGQLYTDGFRIYFTEKIDNRYLIGTVPVSGDSDPVYLSTPSKNPWVAGMFPGGESLLVGDSWPPEAFWKVRLPGGSSQPMEKVKGTSVRMAPDGQHYVYEGPRSLFVADLQTGKSRRIYSSEHSLVLGANWSPDSTMLCFSRVDPEADKGADAVSLWAVNADGSNLRELVLPQTVPGAGSCSWTPGDKYLLFFRRHSR